jgi:hypothetical protein
MRQADTVEEGVDISIARFNAHATAGAGMGERLRGTGEAQIVFGVKHGTAPGDGPAAQRDARRRRGVDMRRVPLPRQHRKRRAPMQNCKQRQTARPPHAAIDRRGARA